MNQYYVMLTRVLREQINAHRKAFLDNSRRDGNPHRDLGHWTLRLNPIKGGEDRPNYGFAQKWESYLDAWRSLDG
jgi:hypothetical protein